MPRVQFVVEEYDLISNVSWTGERMSLTLSSGSIRGHGTLIYSLNLYASSAPATREGTFQHLFTSNTFTYKFSKSVTPAFLDHVYKILVHERPVTATCSYEGDEILPFLAPEGEDTYIKRKLRYFTLWARDEPVGEIEALNELLEEES